MQCRIAAFQLSGQETSQGGGIINYEGKLPKEVKIKDKTVNEKLQLIEQLEEEDKQAVYRIIDGMLTKSKFKDFFNKNVAML